MWFFFCIEDLKRKGKEVVSDVHMCVRMSIHVSSSTLDNCEKTTDPIFTKLCTIVDMLGKFDAVQVLCTEA